MAHTPFRLPRPKDAPMRQPGAVVAQSGVTRRDGGKETVVISRPPKIQAIETSVTGASGVSGIAMGLTIPGPEKSYMTARIDVFCSLPHGPSDEESKSAIDRASNIVQERLEVESKEIAEFFSQYGKR